MLKHVLALAVAFAFLAPATATAHGVWYDTASDTARAIEDKFPAVREASCKPVPAANRRLYGVYSQMDGTARTWNHFLCTIQPSRTPEACLALAHLTGERWSDFIVTSWRHGPRSGCTTRALKG